MQMFPPPDAATADRESAHPHRADTAPGQVFAPLAEPPSAVRQGSR